MSREQIAARLDGLPDYISNTHWNEVLDEVESIVREAVEAEREACAKEADAKADCITDREPGAGEFGRPYMEITAVFFQQGTKKAAQRIAKAIRARGDAL